MQEVDEIVNMARTYLTGDYCELNTRIGRIEADLATCARSETIDLAISDNFVTRDEVIQMISEYAREIAVIMAREIGIQNFSINDDELLDIIMRSS